MYLSQAVRASESVCFALVGAGGKTSAMFTLARQLQRPVFVTTTTHIAVEQVRLADRHIILGQPSKLEDFLSDHLPAVTLLTGQKTEGERLKGPDLFSLQGLYEWARQRDVPLLIEADGSRRLPLKAPADYEPVIPAFVDKVIVVAGLSGLGQPLGFEHVHRPDIFSRLTGLAPGETITPQALIRLLCHPEGGLKNIPPGAHRVILLNQADTPELQAQANMMAPGLLDDFETVIVSSLHPGQALPGEPLSRVAFPNTIAVQAPESDQVVAVHEPVAGVILAAGSGSRIGQPKQLLQWRGESFIHIIAREALSANLDPVVVISGYASEQIQGAVSDLPVHVAYNPEWRGGQSSSVKAGLRTLPGSCGACLFLLADQPLVSRHLIRSLVEEHAHTLAPIIAPLIDGQRGNPVLFDRVTFPDLLSLQGDIGGRALFSRFTVSYIPWHDQNALIDVDTDMDYKRLLELNNDG